MKTKRHFHPTAAKFSILRQICNLIPPHLVPKLARQTGNDQKERTFSSWSQVVALGFAHLTHALGLNDVCDALRMHHGLLSTLRGATPPSRNNFSYANRERDPALAEQLFWAMLEHLQRLSPGFAGGRAPGYLRRFRRAIHVVDATTIQGFSLCGC